MLKLQAEFTDVLVFWQKLLNLRHGVNSWFFSIMDMMADWR